ncbi:MAG: hypothetical protein HRT77_17630 [Halioglobus sp.]|jgi:paraquat-inducible protein B|nr:hypothetical protein [Halioglobus sp.]
MKPMVKGLASIASVLLLSCASQAQTSRPAAEPPASSGDTPLLAGPTVERAPEGQNQTTGRRGARQRLAVPPRRWFRLVNELDLDPQQQQQIRKIMQELQTQQRQFQRKNAVRISELQASMRQLTAQGDEQGAAELRQGIQELRATAPDPVKRQQQIWDLLTQDQQNALRQRLAEARQEIAKQQSDRRAKDGGPRGPADMDPDERRRQFLESRQR